MNVKIHISFILGVIIILLTLSVPGMASVPPQNTPEVQQLSTTTGFDVIGTVIESDAITWRLSSEVLDNNIQFGINKEIPVENDMGHWLPIPDDENPDWVDWLYFADGGAPFDSYPYPDQPPGYEYTQIDNEPPLNPAGEVQMVNSYMENTVAMSGQTNYIKSTGLITSPQPISKFNVKAEKIVSFTALNGGRMTSEEDMLLDNVGKSVNVIAGNGDVLSTLCPFAPSSIGNCTPAFCNIIQSGSRVEVYTGSLVTNAQSRSVAQDTGLDTWPPLPIVDGPPVQMDYSIRVGGVGTGNTAEGSAMAYLKAHKLEGSRECPTGFLGAGQDLTYNEVTSATGSIAQFQKFINYQSGFKLTG